MKKAFALLPLAAVWVVGCNSDSGSQPSTTGSSSTASTGASSSSTTTPDSTAKPPASTTTDSKGAATKQPDSAATGSTASLTLPDDLKHEGYQYEGFANTKPVDMEEKTTGENKNDFTGSQSIALSGVKGDVATYLVTRTGGLEALGTETYEVRKDGVYAVTSTKMSLGGSSLDLPADPTPGKTWSIHVTADNPDAKMDLTLINKIVGKETVRTTAGVFNDALAVEQTGQGTQQGQKVRISAKQWYVKGLGVVKSELKMYLPKKKVTTSTIQVTHEVSKS